MAKRYVVSARLEADDRASPEIDRVQGRFGRLGNFLRSNWVVITAAATAGIAAFTAAMKASVAAASEYEDRVRSLEAALAGLGEDRAAKVSAALQAQADGLQRVTRFSNDAIVEAQALLATLGVQADQIPLATRATLDLAAAFDQSLTEAARNVGRTVGGFAGELGEIVPELRNLSAEALRSGEGIEVLAAKFAGRAAAEADTFSGAVGRLENALQDLKVTTGSNVTESERLAAALRGVAVVVETLNAGLASNSVGNFVSGLGEGLRSIQVGTTTLGDLLEGLARLGQESSSLDELATRAERFERAMALLRGTVEDASAADRAAAENLRTLAAVYGSAEEAVNRYLDAQERASRVQRELAEGQKSLREALEAVGVGFRDFGAELEGLERALALVRQEELAGAISREQAAFFTEQLTAKISALRGELQGEGDAAGAAAEGLDQAARKTRELGDDADRARQNVAGLREELDRADEAGRRFIGGPGSAFGGTLFGGSRLFPDSPVANSATRGGRLVRVLPDGRRTAA